MKKRYVQDEKRKYEVSKDRIDSSNTEMYTRKDSSDETVVEYIEETEAEKDVSEVCNLLVALSSLFLPGPLNAETPMHLGSVILRILLSRMRLCSV